MFLTLNWKASDTKKLTLSYYVSTCASHVWTWYIAQRIHQSWSGWVTSACVSTSQEEGNESFPKNVWSVDAHVWIFTFLPIVLYGTSFGCPVNCLKRKIHSFTLFIAISQVQHMAYHLLTHELYGCGPYVGNGSSWCCRASQEWERRSSSWTRLTRLTAIALQCS